MKKEMLMESVQPVSVFAQVVDKLRNKSEEELKMLYVQLSANELTAEWKSITAATNFENVTEEDIIKVIQRNRYSK